MAGDAAESTSDGCRVDDPRVRDLPPSAKVVYLVLQADDELTRSALQSRTALPPQTLDDGLAALRDVGVVRRRTATGDARYSLYKLC